jgi:hypothetical protein
MFQVIEVFQVAMCPACGLAPKSRYEVSLLSKPESWPRGLSWGCKRELIDSPAVALFYRNPKIESQVPC